MSIEEAINLSFERKPLKSKKLKKSKTPKIDPLQIICQNRISKKK